MKRWIFLLLLCACCFGAGAQTGLSYRIIPAANATWGYDIYRDGKMLVHQPTVPGVPGNSGFHSRSSAGKVARLVLEKIRKGQLPPTVGADELKKLKVR